MENQNHSETSKADVTAAVKLATSKAPGAAEQLLPLVYDQLRRLASNYLARERSDHTLQATALVHEAYVRLVDQSQVAWKDRAHFSGVAARIMRQILVDHARRRGRQKRQATGKRLSLEEELFIGSPVHSDLERLDDALNQLALIDARAAKVVEFRFFGGMQVREVAEVLNVSERTVAQDWAYAKSWLHKELKD